MPVSRGHSLLLRSNEQNHTQNDDPDIPKRMLNSDVLSSVVSLPGLMRLAATARLLIPGKAVAPSSILPLDHALWQGDVEMFLQSLPKKPLFDLVVTSPPYNIGKEYETRTELDKYLKLAEKNYRSSSFPG